jgi:hypothetical protein
MKLDIIRYSNNVMTHKQIEKRAGRLYVRVKRRPIKHAEA